MQLITPHPETRNTLEWRYQAKAPLTSIEASFHTCLANLSHGRCHILCKPRLADFLHSQDGLTAFTKISQKHIDFLICRPGDWLPMLGIEIDDPTHQQLKNKERDTLVNSIFAQVGIPLVRVHISELQRIELLVEKLSLAWKTRCERLEVALIVAKDEAEVLKREPRVAEVARRAA